MRPTEDMCAVCGVTAPAHLLKIRFCVPNHLSSFGRYAPPVPLWALRASRPALGATRLSSRFGRYAPLLVTWGATRLSSLKLKRKRLSQGAAQTLPSHPSASSHPSSSAAHPSRTAPLHLHIPQQGTHITVLAYHCDNMNQIITVIMYIAYRLIMIAHEVYSL